ncbi:hypothetical protein D3C72_736110 [compost metagenome]
MELVHLVVREDLGLELRRARHRVAVDLEQLVERHGVFRDVEVAGVREQKAQRVADAAVGVDDAREDLVVARDVARVVARGHPQADDFRAQLVADFLRVDAVLERLAHLDALGIHREAVREQALVRCTVFQHAGDQQRRVEPAAVLVVAFEVQVGLGAGLVVHVGVRAAQHVREGRARVEPHLEDVGALGVARCVFGAQDVFDRDAAPGLDAALLDDVGGLVEDFHGARVQLARILVQEERDRHAPAALAADAPVGPAGDHVVQAGLAVLGVEAGLLDGVERGLAQRLGRLVLGEHAFAFVHANEPLGGRAVDHRRLVAPAVRVAVGDGLGGQQPVGVAQRGDDHRHGLPDVLAAEQREVGRVAAVALHRVQDVVVRHAVGDAGVEVVHAVGRRGVHEAGAVGGGGVVGQVDGRQALVARVHVVQRVLELEPAERLALDRGQHLAVERVARHAHLDQRVGQDQQAALGVDQRVLELGVEVDRLVGGDRPRGGGPDHGEDVAQDRVVGAEGLEHLLALVRLEGHVDGLALLVGVFDLEFGQRGAAVEAPVHGLEAPVHEAALDHALERAQLAGFIGEVHRLVGVVPFAQHAQALEVDHLLGDLLGGVGAALGLHVVAAQVAAELLFDGVLDRQAVAVPAGHVQRVEAFELARLGDHVLQDLVHRVTHVDLAVGVRRAVVQDELGRAVAGVAQAVVAAFVVPFLDPARFALGQVAAHREGGVGQVQRGTVIFGGSGVRHVGVRRNRGASTGSARTALSGRCGRYSRSP